MEKLLKVTYHFKSEQMAGAFLKYVCFYNPYFKRNKTKVFILGSQLVKGEEKIYDIFHRKFSELENNLF